MRKLFYPLLLVALGFSACNKEGESVVQKAEVVKSTKLLLSVKGDNKEDLFIQGDKGLKSSALSFVSVVNIGDTIIWELAEESNILSIEDIIIVSSDCGDLLFDNGIIFNENQTRCYVTISDKAYGNAKYDIKYKFKDGSTVIVDPSIEIMPPPK